MKVIEVRQGSSDWLAARAGVFTASELDNLISPTWKKREGDTPQTYILRKVAERVMGFPLGDVNTWAMEQGSLLEAEAIPWFEFAHDTQVQRVGFVTTDDGRVGCSPDGLVGDDGGIEVKCPQPPAHLKYLLGGGVPKDYLAQVHGSLYVTGRKWWNFLSYSRHFPPLLVRVERDEKIMAAIDEAVQSALADFEDKLARVRALKDAADAPMKAAYEAESAHQEAAARAANGGETPGERWMREQGRKTS